MYSDGIVHAEVSGGLLKSENDEGTALFSVVKGSSEAKPSGVKTPTSVAAQEVAVVPWAIIDSHKLPVVMTVSTQKRTKPTLD